LILLNLGDVNYNVTAKLTGINNAVKQIDKLGASATRATNQIERLSKASGNIKGINNLSKAQKNAAKSTDALTRKQISQQKGVLTLQKQWASLNSKLGGANKSLETANKKIRSLNANVSKGAINSTNYAKTQLEVQKAFFAANKEAGVYTKKVSNTSKAVGQSVKNLKAYNTQLNKIRNLQSKASAKNILAGDPRVFDNLNKSLARYNKVLNSSNVTTMRAAKAQQGLNNRIQSANRLFNEQASQLHKTNNLFQSFAQGIKSVGTAFAAFIVFETIQDFIRSIFEASDSFKLLRGRMSTVTDSQKDLNQTWEEMVDLANRTRSDLGATIQFYTRARKSMQGMGRSAKEAKDVTEVLNNSLLASGASAQEAASSALQLSQSFAKGKVDGEEFRAILENNIVLVTAVGDQFKKTGETAQEALFRMRDAGELSAEKFVTAMLNAQDSIKELAGLIPTTMGQALTQMRNRFTDLIGNIDKVLKISDSIVGIFQSIADAFANMNTESIDSITGSLQTLFKILDEVLVFLTSRWIAGWKSVGSVLAGLSTAWGRYVTGTIAATAATEKFNKVAGILGGILKRIGWFLVISLVYNLGSAFLSAADKAESLNSKLNDVFNTFGKLRNIRSPINPQVIDKALKQVKSRIDDVNRSISSVTSGLKIQRFNPDPEEVTRLEQLGEQYRVTKKLLKDMIPILQDMKKEAIKTQNELMKIGIPPSLQDDAKSFANTVAQAFRDVEAAMIIDADSSLKPAINALQRFEEIIAKLPENIRDDAGAILKTLGVKLPKGAKLSTTQMENLKEAARAYGISLNSANKDVLTALMLQKSLGKETETATDALKDYREELQNLAKEPDLILKKIEILAKSQELFSEHPKQFKKLMQGLASDYAEMTGQAEEFGKLHESISKTLDEPGKLKKELETLGKTGDVGLAKRFANIDQQLNNISDQNLSKILDSRKGINNIEQLEKSMKDAARQSEKLSKKLEVQRNAVSKQAEIDYIPKAIKELNKLYSSGSISLRVFNEETARLYDEMGGLKSIADDAASTIADGFADAIVEGKSLRGVINSIDKALARMIIQETITKPLKKGIQPALTTFADYIGGALAGGSSGGGQTTLVAKGGVFENGNKLTAYAKGGVVESPTIFPMANGAGLMGEAGPEAVLPLTRTSGGDLGVKSAGNGSPSEVYVQIIDQRQGGQQIEQEHDTGPNGEQIIRAIVREETKAGFNNGNFDKTMKTNFGIKRAGRTR